MISFLLVFYQAINFLTNGQKYLLKQSAASQSLPMVVSCLSSIDIVLFLLFFPLIELKFYKMIAYRLIGITYLVCILKCGHLTNFLKIRYLFVIGPFKLLFTTDTFKFFCF